MKEILKIKSATFFYNKTLLNAIAKEESNFVRLNEGFLKPLNIGDLVKFIGNQISCIVELVTIEPKDCNGNCATTIKLKKIVKGELEIEY